MTFHRRGVWPIFVLLALVVSGVIVQIVHDPAASPPAGAQATPTPTVTPATGAAREVLQSLAAVESAYAAGNVRRLCRPGALVDPAVIRARDAASNGCEGEVESLMAFEPQLRLTLRKLTVKSDLATAEMTTATGAEATVDFVRRGGRWLLSFSNGNDPLPALAGTT